MPTTLPEGYVWDQPESKLPEGYAWDQPESTPAYYAKDIAKGIEGGAVKGAFGRFGLGGDVRHGIESGISGLHGIITQSLGLDPEKQAQLDRHIHDAVDTFLTHLPGPLRMLRGPTSQQYAEKAKELTGYVPPEAETVPGQYVQTGAQFVTSGLGTGPGGMISDAIKYGLVPAAASETAGQLTKGTPTEPIARGLAAVGGAGIPAAVEHFRPSSVAQAVRRQLPENVTQAEVTAAEKLMQDAASGPNPVNLTWPEALSQVRGSPTLTHLQRVVESAPQSRAPMEEFIGQRPGQIQAAAQETFGKIAPPTAEPSIIGPQVGAAAEQTTNALRKAINDYTDPLYEKAAGTLLSGREMTQVYKIPGFRAAAEKVANDPQLSRYVEGRPANSVGFLNEVKKVLDRQAEHESDPFKGYPQRAAGFRSDAAAVRQAAINAETRQGSTAYQDALRLQQQARDKYLAPYLQGPLGRMADRDLTTQKAINVLLPSDPLPASEKEIEKAVAGISARNPLVARQLVRAHLEKQLDEAFNAGGRGQEAPQFAGAGFAVRVAGSPVVDTQKFENLKAAVSALPNGQKTWEGFQRFLDVARATGTRMPKGSMTAFNEREMQMLSGGSSVLGFVKEATSPERWLNMMHEHIGHWQQGRNLKGLAALLTDQTAGDTFRKIAAAPPESRKAMILAIRLMAQAGPVFRQANQPRPEAQQPVQ